MDYAEAKRIQIGDRVIVCPDNPSRACTGTVKEANADWVGIKWDDGGGIGSLHRRDMEIVSRFDGEGVIVPQRRAES